MKTLFVSLLVLAMSAAPMAQKKPDFSGVWVPVPVKAAAAAATGGTVGLAPSDLAIQHSSAALSISRTAFDTVNTQTYRLDGSESTNKSGAVTSVTRSRWEGPRLIIEGKKSQVTSAGYAAWTVKETYSLNGRGRLVLESEYKGSDGAVTTSIREFTRKPAK